MITDGYSIWGSSAGGHLAAFFGTDAIGYSRFGLSKPGALILCYPVITMGERTHSGSRQNLLGSDPEEALIALTSVEKQITDHYPPTFVWCGNADRTVDPENSRMLAAELEKNSIPHRFVEYPGVDHGVGLGKGLACESWFEEAVTFWESQRNKMR
ncbi:MAG: alpha/beta hydrolase [Acetatifactor sp.]